MSSFLMSLFLRVNWNFSSLWHLFSPGIQIHILPKFTKSYRGWLTPVYYLCHYVYLASESLSRYFISQYMRGSFCMFHLHLSTLANSLLCDSPHTWIQIYFLSSPSLFNKLIYSQFLYIFTKLEDNAFIYSSSIYTINI